MFECITKDVDVSIGVDCALSWTHAAVRSSHRLCNEFVVLIAIVTVVIAVVIVAITVIIVAIAVVVIVIVCSGASRNPSPVLAWIWSHLRRRSSGPPCALPFLLSPSTCRLTSAPRSWSRSGIF